MKKNCIELLRKLIKEEIGRNIKTAPHQDAMTDWRHIDGIDANIFVSPKNGGWYVKITSEDEELPYRLFKDETSAKFWAREQVLKLQRKKMNKA